MGGTLSGREGFTVLYELEGGDLGGMHQMLLITTDPQMAKKPASNEIVSDEIVSDDNFACWKRRYLVTPRTARKIEGLISEVGYDDLPSFPGDIDTDMYRWKVTVYRGNHATSIQVSDSPGVYWRFTDGPTRRQTSADNEEVRCATVLFDLVDNCDELARAEGTLVQ